MEVVHLPKNDADEVKGKPDISSVDIETALTITGFGKFHWGLLFVCGLTYMAFCYQGIVSSFIGPASQCDLKLTSQDQGLLNAIFIIGGMSSAIVWGILADQYGRRKVLIIALFADGIATCASSVVQSFNLLLFFRFFSGLMMVAPGSVILTYLVEVVGTKYRSKCLISMGAFCTLAFVVLPLLALGILPIEWKYQTENFTFNSWRMLILVSSLPSLLSATLLLTFFYESPKFLYSQGNIGKALYVIESIYYINFGSSRGSFPIKNIVKNPAIDARRSTLILDPDNLDEIVKTGKSDIKLIFKGIRKQTKQILKPPYLYYSILANTLMFTSIFAYYGLALWMPEIFDRLADHAKVSDVPLTVCELTDLKMEALRNQTISVLKIDEESCEKTNVDISVYYNTFIIGVVTVVGNILFACIESKFGNKLLTIVTMFVASGSTLAVYFVNTTWQNLLASCIFLTFTEAATMVIQAAASNLFPTNIRGLAMCLAWLAGRSGACASNLIIGNFIDTMCELPILLMSGLLFFGTAVGFLLPSKSSEKKKAAI